MTTVESLTLTGTFGVNYRSISANDIRASRYCAARNFEGKKDCNTHAPPVALRRRRQRRLPELELPAINIPRELEAVDIRLHERVVTLTNLRKVFWPESGITKA